MNKIHIFKWKIPSVEVWIVLQFWSKLELLCQTVTRLTFWLWPLHWRYIVILQQTVGRKSAFTSSLTLSLTTSALCTLGFFLFQYRHVSTLVPEVTCKWFPVPAGLGKWHYTSQSADSLLNWPDTENTEKIWMKENEADNGLSRTEWPGGGSLLAEEVLLHLMALGHQHLHCLSYVFSLASAVFF